MSSIIDHGYTDWIEDEYPHKEGQNKTIKDKFGYIFIEKDNNFFNTLEECILKIKDMNNYLESKKRNRIHWLIVKQISRKTGKIKYYILPCTPENCVISCQAFPGYTIKMYDTIAKKKTPTIKSRSYHKTTEIY